MGLPTVFYGFNHVYIANKQANIVIDFNTIDSLSYSSFQKQKLFSRDQSTVDPNLASVQTLVLENSGLSEKEKCLNLIDIIPEQVVVKQADTWKNKDTSKIKDF